MTTTAPGQQTVKPRRVTTRSAVRHDQSLVDQSLAPSRDQAFDDDSTEYPESEIMCREPVENDICSYLMLLLRRYLAERGIVSYVGSDSFIYWQKGNIKACVSPDIYILPGIAQTIPPAHYPGSNDEQCWKTWIHHVAPNFAIEVKSRRSPRKDELQSPARHDALGTKELIVFDPFLHRRRAHRKRFVVYRRNAVGTLGIVLETNGDRVYSEQLDAFVVVQGEADRCLLRIGLGPNGDTLVPFDSELADIQAQRAAEATQRADQEASMRQEEARRADEQARLATEALRRNAELEAELARLRADANQHSPRRSKSEKSRIGR